jgi:DNA repair protein RadC
MSNLMIKTGSRYRKARPSEVCEQASAYLFQQAARQRTSLASPSAAREFLRAQAGLEFEQFGVVYLDNRHKVISVNVLFNGTIDGASVHPRVVVTNALREGAAAVILFHNHPSGICESSNADELITKRLKEALALVDVRVLDHIIIAAQGTFSFAERGLL